MNRLPNQYHLRATEALETLARDQPRPPTRAEWGALIVDAHYAIDAPEHMPAGSMVSAPSTLSEKPIIYPPHLWREEA